jgi:hypothetical protein
MCVQHLTAPPSPMLQESVHVDDGEQRTGDPPWGVPRVLLLPPLMSLFPKARIIYGGTSINAADGLARDLAFPDRGSAAPARGTSRKPSANGRNPGQHPPAASPIRSPAADRLRPGFGIRGAIRSHSSSQVRWVALSLPGDLGHSASLLACPHPNCETYSQRDRNPGPAQFSNRL